MISKKGSEGDMLMTIIKLLIAGFFILFLVWLIANIFSNTHNQGTTQQYKNLVKKLLTIEDNGSTVFPLWQIDSAYGEYGFNAEPDYVKIENENNPIKKPRTKCSFGAACFCLCDKQCDKVYECNTIPGIKRMIITTDFPNNYGKGVEEFYGEDFKDWEFLAAIGEYKGKGAWKIRWDQNKFGRPMVNISRTGDTLYFWPCDEEHKCG